MLDADRAVQAVEHRDHGVGGAGRVRHQALGATQLVLVDAEHHRGIHILGTVARVGEQQARAAGVDEALQLAAAAVLPGALDDEVELERGPVDVLRRARVAHLDRMPVHDEIAFAAVHHARKTTVGGVEAGQVGDAGEVGGLVDRDDAVAPGEAGLLQGAQVAAADAAVAVDGDAEGAFGAARRGARRTGGRARGRRRAGDVGHGRTGASGDERRPRGRRPRRGPWACTGACIGAGPTKVRHSSGRPGLRARRAKKEGRLAPPQPLTLDVPGLLQVVLRRP